MSPTGLRGLLDGAASYGKTRDKARLWYTLHHEQRGAEIAPETVYALVRTLFSGLPEPYRYAANARVLNAFQDGFLCAGVAPPRWIVAVRELNDLGGPNNK